jgi:hypothetical protein
MKICVYGPPGDGGEQQPRVFYLGARRLSVVAVLGCWLEAGHRCYKVSVGDGRHFVLRHEPVAGLWELAAVYRAGHPPARARTLA